jgi:hypothetical protein
MDSNESSPEHLFVWRIFCGVPYQHHGVHLGDNTVVHFADPDPLNSLPSPAYHRIIHTGVAQFLKSDRDTDLRTALDQALVHKVRHRRPLPAEQVRQRALDKVGAGDYHLLSNNCEHFANWCLTGQAESRQVHQALKHSASLLLKSVACVGGKKVMKRAVTGSACFAAFRTATSPWTLAADVVQGTTELCGAHLGLTDPRQRARISRSAGALTAALCGLPGGPVGVLSTTAIWLTSELLGSAGAALTAAELD